MTSSTPENPGHPRQATTPGTTHTETSRPAGITAARERYDELTGRDATARAIATLKARGSYDPHRHASADAYPPLTTAEHLEVLALGETLAAYYRHPADLHHAVQAGASWQQIADATGNTPDRARQRYQQWADGQHRLRAEHNGTLGLTGTEHAAALRRATGPDREAGQ
jgi:hypothetical protein